MLGSFAVLVFAGIGQTPPSSLSELGTQYGFEVEVPTSTVSWQGQGYTVKGEPTSQDALEKYTQLFANEWKLYPVSFVKKAKVFKITFCVSLSLNNQFRAAVPSYDADRMFYDTAAGAYNSNYQRNVVHHEYFHMVDQREKRLYTDPEWASLNPPDFKYGSGGAQMRTSGAGSLTDKIPGFLTLYGTSGVEEDKAELFAHMIVDGEFVANRAKLDPVLNKKIGLLKKRLTEFDSSMGDLFWKKIPGWKPVDDKLPILGLAKLNKN
ncbi:MAG: hypothetical protein KF836_07375 [Fimbriimonadaceae bacterium]|nr:hypothetical protein [Fimbriimonadaceae bacterium]